MARTVGLILEPGEHKAAEVFTCRHCGKEYKTETALKGHVKKEHPDVFDDTDE